MNAAEHKFPGSTAMHQLVHQMNWSETPLGSVENWSSSLVSSVRLVLTSQFAMILSWGDDHIQIYNDAYAPIIGERHPAIGQDVRVTLAEGWPLLQPLFEQALATGEATWLPSLQFPIVRGGITEETYFTVSHTPISDDDGTARGILTIANEVTEEVVGARRLSLYRELASVPSALSCEADFVRALTRAVSKLHLDVPFVHLFLHNAEGLELIASSHPDLVQDTSQWVTDSALGELVIFNIPDGFEVNGGPWDTPVSTAVTATLVDSTGDALGFMVLGVSPARLLDDAYKGFFLTIVRQVSSALGSARAFTATQERAAAFEQLDRVKTAFFNNMSHEMRTPMNAIVGGSTLLLGTELDEEQVELTNMMNASAGHLLKIINDVLDYSKLDANAVEYATDPFDPTALIEEALSVVHIHAQRNGLTMARSDSNELPRYCVGDASRIRQVLLNLLSNSVKFTSSGSILLDASYDDGLVIQITDTGVGIPTDKQDSIFDAFSQVDKKVSTGTGIGLSITRSFVLGMGGSIEFDSTLGEGTRFTIKLPTPITDLQPVDQTPIEVSARVAEENPLRILMAEDHPVNQQVLLALLGRLGYTSDVAATGVEAVEAAKSTQYDLILMDVQMPDMTGLEAAAIISEMATPWAAPRIVAVTANARHENREEAWAAGMSGYLAKPITMNALTDILKSAEPGLVSTLESDEVIDYERIQSLVPSSILPELLKSYEVSTASLLDRIEAAVRTDEANLDLLLHQLKGSSATIGATRMAKLLGEAEDSGNVEVSVLRSVLAETRAAFATLTPAR